LETTTLPAVTAQEDRVRRLANMKRTATATLLAVSLVFLAVTLFGGDGTFAGYLQATAEAGMVGGLADWFAVTALFRHPLGIPIPHTAIIVERKDKFAETLGDFVQDSFLNPASISERLRRGDIPGRVAAWASEPESARRTAGEVLSAAVAMADLVKDEDVHRALDGALRARADGVALAPLAGRVLRVATADGRHDEVLDAAIRGFDRYVREHRDELHERLAESAPWWLPGPVETRLFERIIEGVSSTLQAMVDDHEHPLRVSLLERVDELAVQLETSPELRARGEALKQQILDQPELQQWLGSLWRDLKQRLRTEAETPGSQLHEWLADRIMEAGRRLAEDPELAAALEAAVTRGIAYMAERFQGEVSALVRTTIERWDATETAFRLELLLGPDLQFIRINGTVVGAMAGLALHAIAQALG
jgi:uncharacterized membrane-anchored protein YjiN (DUF445 family)